jgi:homogentisate 1,2-dioxygenase
MGMRGNGYMSGFGNEFATEAVPGALPVGRNSPQKVAHGLYAEQLSGTAFTAPRAAEPAQLAVPDPAGGDARRLRTVRAAALPQRFGDGPVARTSCAGARCRCRRRRPTSSTACTPWPATARRLRSTGVGIHLYAANRDDAGRYFYDADGELLIVPQQGRLRIATELGVLEVEPQEIAVVPRGVRFRVELPDGPSRGYVCENFGALLRLPDLGPIGSNGLANPRDFLTPGPRTRTARATSSWSPSSRATVARRRSATRRWTWSPGTATTRPTSTTCAASTPSARSASTTRTRASSWCCTSPSDTPGVGNLDFVIFPPRILAMRRHLPPALVPPQHRQRVHGPGARRLRRQGRRLRARRLLAAQLHDRARTGRGDLREGEQRRPVQARRDRDTMAFMFETRAVIRPTAGRRRRAGSATTRPAGRDCAGISAAPDSRRSRFDSR